MAIITLLATVFFFRKLIPLSKHINEFHAEAQYSLSYQFFFKTNNKNTNISSFLPQSNERQNILNPQFRGSEDISFQKMSESENLKGIWSTTSKNKYRNIEYAFSFLGKAKTYSVPMHVKTDSSFAQDYLNSTERIQSNDYRIEAVAKKIRETYETDRQRIKAIFDFVQAIPSAPIITRTDAVATMEQNQASCNGKSRLFTALARNLGYPTRIKGGLILEQNDKRTSHAWVELYLNTQWVPFDTHNNHYAYLPANYLELYEGDHALITHTKDIIFDYNYHITEELVLPYTPSQALTMTSINQWSLVPLLKKKVVSKQTLSLLLLLPLGGLIVAFLRNVVGLKTFGVFLPVLIAFALKETSFVSGISIFLFLVLVVGIASYPFTRLGLLQTPKLVISLTLMVMVIIIGSCLGLVTNYTWLLSLSCFPIIILTVSAERFSALIIEEGFQKATGLLIQTLVSVSICYAILSSVWLASFLIIFPEVLLIIIVAAMLLGRYFGLRWSELIRFRPVLKLNTA